MAALVSCGVEGCACGSIVLVGARIWVGLGEFWVGASEVCEGTVDMRPSGARLLARCCVAVIALFIASVPFNDERTSLMIPSNSCCKILVATGNRPTKYRLQLATGLQNIGCNWQPAYKISTHRYFAGVGCNWQPAYKISCIRKLDYLKGH